MIRILHLSYDLTPEERLAVTSPAPPEGVDDGREPLGPAGWRAEAARRLLGRGGYHEVATVVTDDIEVALRLTQNGIASPSWSRQPPPGVIPTPPGHVLIRGREYGFKSTEVGDLMVRDGRTYVVDTFGFAEIPTDG